MRTDDPAYRGQAGYTPRLLAIYDYLALKFMARWVWRCPTTPWVARYRQLLGRRHLDVGPGTGFFLDKADGDAELTLLDPNPNVLAHASARLARMDVSSVEADVLKPLPLSGSFDSAALSFVLHCLPGPQIAKAAAIRNVAAVLAPHGVLFGGTILGRSGRHTPQARLVLWAFNRHGDFDNLDDTEEQLRAMLEDSFHTVNVEVVGSAALFTATDRR